MDREAPEGRRRNFVSIVFTDRLNGFAAGSNGTFLRTTDGGDTWTSSSLGTSTINSIAFADD
jgi:photosystem II stability/assembly factor-like uncharacterized protein